MIIEGLEHGVVRLAEPFDFRRFKLVLHGDGAKGAQSWSGIAVLDARDGLVSIDLVPTLAGCPDDASWNQGYADMIAKARELGWIDAERHAIRAHIEWNP
ncbi:hypothetical protein [Bradyrhizobium sp. 150]|uniref:hypothetical protein n=1 Tax=Bradyrhizobium sp. 150 TaxID=2782625 RepID=UPI001FF78A32|nr:hypothetical protein [Bradyrhizobium sp. 150]